MLGYFFCKGVFVKILINKYINREKFTLRQQNVNIRLRLQIQSGDRSRSDKHGRELSILGGMWYQLLHGGHGSLLRQKMLFHKCHLRL